MIEALPIPATKRPVRVFLVEDDDDAAQMMVVLLGHVGYSVARAGDVATALDRVARGEFDLLISDLKLPDRSGLELVRELRSSGSTLPAIALSGHGLHSDLKKSREAGFNAHVVKPFHPPTLFAVMERVLANSMAVSGAEPVAR
jgi:CheY-like chemotaxis protein